MKRAVVPLVAVLLVAVVALGVFPTRQWWAQRATLQTTQQRLDELTEENRRLDGRVATLQTDAEIERLAREQYNLVRPGEQAFAILPAPEPPPPPPAPERRNWFERTFDSLF